jgi:hypothetical protein
MNLGGAASQDSGHPELARKIAASEIGNLAFLVTAQGRSNFPAISSRSLGPRSLGQLIQ